MTRYMVFIPSFVKIRQLVKRLLQWVTDGVNMRQAFISFIKQS